MKQIKVTGYVPINEKELTTLNECDIKLGKLREQIRDGLFTKEDIQEQRVLGNTKYKKVCVTATFTVDEVCKKSTKVRSSSFDDIFSHIKRSSSFDDCARDKI
jgi:hypothetical protein